MKILTTLLFLLTVTFAHANDTAAGVQSCFKGLGHCGHVTNSALRSCSKVRSFYAGEAIAYTARKFCATGSITNSAIKSMAKIKSEAGLSCVKTLVDSFSNITDSAFSTCSKL